MNGQTYRVHQFGTGGQTVTTATGTFTVAAGGLIEVLVVGPADNNTAAVWSPGSVMYLRNLSVSPGAYSIQAGRGALSGTYGVQDHSFFTSSGNVENSIFLRGPLSTVSTYAGYTSDITGTSVIYGKANATSPGSSVASASGSYSGTVIIRYPI